MMARICCGIIILLGCLEASWGQIAATEPALIADSQPSTEASTEPAGPQAAFESFVSAMMEGRAGDIRSLSFAEDDDSRAVLKDIEQMTSAAGELRKMVAEKFGAEATDNLQVFFPPDAMDSLKEIIDGDKATLKSDQIEPIQMVRIAGKWKVDIAALKRDDLPEDAHGYLAAQGKAMTRTAEDISSGRLSTLDMTREALAARQEDWEPPSATQVSTQILPATMP
jgi:hypothetical protein